MPKEKFNPEGPNYDYVGAKEAGLEPQAVPDDTVPHWPSRNPQSGVLLKGRSHPTFQKGVDADAALGYKLKQRDDGRYVTEQPSYKKGGLVQGKQIKCWSK